MRSLRRSLSAALCAGLVVMVLGGCADTLTVDPGRYQFRPFGVEFVTCEGARVDIGPGTEREADSAADLVRVGNPARGADECGEMWEIRDGAALVTYRCTGAESIFRDTTWIGTITGPRVRSWKWEFDVSGRCSGHVKGDLEFVSP
jgi:hypothetical protein